MIIEAVKDVPFTPKRNADSTTALIFFYETSRDDSANEGLTLSQYVG